MGLYDAPRDDVASWKETFMGMAQLVSKRSKDNYRQVGACIAGSDNRILSVGYNGTPNGFDDSVFPWNKEGDWLESKHPYVVHAERNAILNFRGSLREFNDSTIYVTLFPCHECAKEIIQVGIKRVVFLEGLQDNPKLNKDEYKASMFMFDNTGVEYVSYFDV